MNTLRKIIPVLGMIGFAESYLPLRSFGFGRSRSICMSSSLESIDAVCLAGSDPNRPSKVNQDAYFETYVDGFGPCVGVLDGHGKKGHLLTSYLAKQLPIRLKEQLEHPIQSVEFEEKIETLGKFVQPSARSMVHQALVNAFHQVQLDAGKDADVPSGRSGTTCVVCLIDHKEKKVHVAHVGDSRAIIVTDKNCVPISLETTTKNFDSEKERILQAEGRVDGSGNVFYGPIGIAMTRSLGNAVMLRAGVIPTPLVETIDFPDDDEVRLVVATDGIWEVLSNDDVCTIVRSIGANSASAIADAAKSKWVGNFPVIEEKVDDITCIVLNL